MTKTIGVEAVYLMSTDGGYLHQLDDLQRDPLFILGCHRSGTTSLYQSLAATGSSDDHHLTTQVPSF